MQTLKTLIGNFPSQAINSMLKRETAGERRMAIVNFVNRHPNWFENVDGRILVQTNFGFSIWCDRWDTIGQAIIATGEWEGLLSRTILACLKPGDVAIDIGANIGYDTMLMSTAVGQHGSVVAFEPDLQNLAALLQNIRQLAHANVVVQSVALSDSPGLARIILADRNHRGTSNLRPGETGPSQPILVSRLDSLLDAASVSRIAFVKMDIEGFEHKAIAGMGRLIDRIDCLACEVDPGFLRQCGSSAEALFRTLADHGFMSFCAEPVSKGRWVRSDHNYAIQAEHSHHFDALFCRQVSAGLGPLIG